MATCANCGERIEPDDGGAIWYHPATMRAWCDPEGQEDLARQAEPRIVHRTQPMPNDLIDGGTVIASVLLHDDDARPVTWVLLLLRRSAPFYEVIEVDEHGEATSLGKERNIIEAVEIYADNGGDY